MSVKLIALDIDGTLLNSKGVLTSINKEAVVKASKAGVVIVLATGRVFSGLPSDLASSPWVKYVITSNGAAVADMKTGEIICHNCIPKQSILKLQKILDLPEMIYEVYCGGKAYVSKDKFLQFPRKNMPDFYMEYFESTRIMVPDFERFLLEKSEEIESVNIIFGNPNRRKETHEMLKAEKGISVTTSFSFNLEIGAPDANKAQALSELCGILGIAQSEVLACGDNYNDLEMIEYAGIGVAMEHSVDAIKEHANFITKSNDEDGVAFAINKFVLF